MSVGLPPSPFSESDLHGLVDGQLEPARQADVVERLKAHRVLRGRVDAWKEQSDLLKASFSEVENEPIPPALSLTQPPRLKCVTSESWSNGRAAAPAAIRSAPPAPSKRYRRAIFGCGAAIACVGILGSWIFARHATAVGSAPIVLATAEGADGMLVTPSFTASPIKSGALESDYPGHGRAVPPLPIRTIPDLGSAGFRLTGATIDKTDPSALIFSYEDEAANRLMLSVSKNPLDGPGNAPLDDRGVRWRQRDTVYVLRGTPDHRRLSAIATELQARAGDGQD